MSFVRRLLRLNLLTPTVLLLAASAAAQDPGPGRSGAATGPDASAEEIVVTGTSVSDAIDQARFSESNVDVLSAEDFAATGDSGVVDALSRLTGVTAVDGKYVFVRGLSERYSSTLFNGSSLPSPDLLRRVVPLNLFPSGAMDQLSVQKTYTPALPADFAGGLVQMTTRTAPIEREMHFDVSLKGNSRTTGKETNWFEGGGADWTGFDDGFRSLPDGLRGLRGRQTTAEELRALGLSVDRTFDEGEKTLPPGFGMSGSYADRWRTRAGKFGLILSGQGENNWQYQKERLGAQFEGSQTLINPSVMRKTTNSVDYSGLGTLSWAPAESQNVKATLFWSHQTDKRYIEETVREATREEKFFKDVSTEWIEQSLLTAQLGGSHEIEPLHSLLLDWTVAWSQAKREAPDSRSYTFLYDDDGDVTNGLQSDRLIFDGTASSNSRFWEYLTDDAWDIGANTSLPLRLHRNLQSNLRTGLKWFNKQRESEFLQYRYIGPQLIPSPAIADIFVDDRIGPPGGFTIQDASRPEDQYEAEEEILAGYLMAEFEVAGDLHLMAGSRFESFRLTADTDLRNGPFELEDETFFPSVELRYTITDDWQARAAWSRTQNRPDMREFVPARFINREDNQSYRGNPDLSIADLTNYDVSLEWYHGLGDSVEVAAFYKTIENPIQVYALPNQRSRVFGNAEDAWLWGIELAAQQNLRILGRWADDFTVRTNFAYIDSEATEAPGTAVQNLKHPLQGQSDIVFNFMVTHDYLPWNLKNTLALNYTGERLLAVGGKPPGYEGLFKDDQYHNGLFTLDFTLRWSFEMFEQQFGLTFKARNLLDPEYRETRGQVPERVYHQGRDFSLTIGYDF